MLADDGASVAEYHGGVVAGVTMNHIPLVHRGYNDHVVLAGLARYEGAASPRQISNFSKLVPRLHRGGVTTLGTAATSVPRTTNLFLAGAKKEGRCPRFLQAANVRATFSSCIKHELNSRLNAAVLLVDPGCCG